MNINGLNSRKNYTFTIKESQCPNSEYTLCPITEDLRNKIKAVNPQFILKSNAEAECTMRNNHEFITLSQAILEGVTIDFDPFRQVVVNHVAEQIFGNAKISIINCTNKLVTLNEDRRLIVDDKTQNIQLPSSDHNIFVWEDSYNFHIVRQNRANNAYMYSSDQLSTGELLNL